jgi:hypothetical protein
MMPFDHDSRITISRHETVSSCGIAAIVAVLQLAVLARRLSVRHAPRPTVLLAWQSPDTSQTNSPEDSTPSKPTRSYCAGELKLTCGMVVLALAQWLHIMRLSGVRSN